MSDSLNFMIDIYDFGTNMIKGAFFVAKNITDPKTVWDATILCLKQIV